METIVERPAALDVHKAQVTACVRVPAQSGGREQHVAEFATTVRGLLALRDWPGWDRGVDRRVIGSNPAPVKASARHSSAVANRRGRLWPIAHGGVGSADQPGA